MDKTMTNTPKNSHHVLFMDILRIVERQVFKIIGNEFM